MKEECNIPKSIEPWRKEIRELNTRCFKSNMSEDEYQKDRKKIFEKYGKFQELKEYI